EKLQILGDKYSVPEENRYNYKEYQDCLDSGLIDAVFIAVPNSLHHRYAVQAAKAGIHILCEKPLTSSLEEAEEIISVCQKQDVKLMTAYRLHFEETNMSIVELIKEGKIGEPRIFSSVFCMQVKEGDVRLKPELGGGVAWDIGIYCINAARYLFR